MHSVSPNHYSPGSNIYTRVPTRPSTALGAAYYSTDHQLKLSPTCAESSLIIPTTSSTPYIYTSFGGATGTSPAPTSSVGGLNLNPPCDNNSTASNYVLYGTTKKQQSPSRLFGNAGAAVSVTGATTVTTPLISTANYNGFGKTGLVTTTTTGNYDEFISWEKENGPSQLVCIKGNVDRTTIVWWEEADRRIRDSN